MIRLSACVLLAVWFGIVEAQDGASCCQARTPTAAFAAFGADPEFRAAHMEPLPYEHTAQGGVMISFPIAGQREGRAFEVKAKSHSDVVILMFHEWWGLNDYIKREAEKLADSLGGQATVLALDLFDGKVATTRDEAAAFVSDAKEERIQSIIHGAIAYAGPEATIGTIGWCFGGGWSLQAALMAGKQARACVVYYGMPETDPSKLKSLSAPVLGIFGDRDGHITPAVVSKFEAAMKKAGKKLTVRSYDAVHAFANPSNPDHDEASTQDAYSHTLKFFNDSLFK